ncbi:RNA recognition motif [Trifolium medium]|uniref:RNA recognition motif n=1 Tax=Trifolium medium TaxID=97028 RepID=A0A392LW91_9FABA|nr:RNA recognition motif [Trifolium medium]
MSREKERVERESNSIEQSLNGSHRGYIHNVDQTPVSFFITNFPEDSSTEDLWKAFARYGRVGDVYIPSKVDKWGRRFAFMKFREARDVGELSNAMKEVWLGSFKLRTNKSRFAGRSFKSALVEARVRQGVTVKGNKAVEDIREVEVDGTVLKELERSFVGFLAVKVDVKRIKTTLYMEGLTQISAIDMGRIMVLMSSSKEGEIEEAWVKVYGVPLHVWGEKLFKAIGRKYGGFVDFDRNTASRAKLDVARIKVSTNFRGLIDDPVNIQALGVTYSLRIVEEKEMESYFDLGQAGEEGERSWVASSNFPGEAMDGGGCGGSVEEDEEDGEVGIDQQMQGETVLERIAPVDVDGDSALDNLGKGQNQPFMADSLLCDKRGILFEKYATDGSVEEGERRLCGAIVEKETKGVRSGELVDSDKCCGKETCQEGREVKEDGGPGKSACANDMKGDGLLDVEVKTGRILTRSNSFPMTRFDGPVNSLGREQCVAEEGSDSISLIEIKGGVISNNFKYQSNQLTERGNLTKARRGRSRKPRDRSKTKAKSVPRKPTTSNLKFLNLMEVGRDGGRKQRKKKRVAVVVTEVNANNNNRTEVVTGSLERHSEEEQSETVVPETMEGAVLEVVLPGCSAMPKSGIELLIEPVIELLVAE